VRVDGRDIRRRGCLFIVSGPSGAGKTSICTPVLARVQDISLSVSYTPRRPRAGEHEGVDYRFVDASAFDGMVKAGAFAEWAQVHGNRYGTAKADVAAALGAGRDLLLDIDVQGAAQMKASYPEAVAVFLLPPSPKKLSERLVGRKTDDPQTVRTRLRNACAEIRHVGEYDYVIVNEDLETAVNGLMAVIAAERLRVQGIVADDLARVVHAFDSVS
jgi:guanylate kinase